MNDVMSFWSMETSADRFFCGHWNQFSSPRRLNTTIMADDKHSDKSSSNLKNLLETVYEVHRKDIKTYASGHLNLSKLLRPSDDRHKRWEASDKPPIRWVQVSKVNVWVVDRNLGHQTIKFYLQQLGLTTEYRATFERLSVSSGSSARQSIPRYMI